MEVRPSIDFRLVKQRVAIVDALKQIGCTCTRVERSGTRGPCPLHRTSDTRSRIFCITGSTWYCHKCKVGGDVLRLWAILHGVDVWEAARQLAVIFHVPAIRYSPGRVPGEQRRGAVTTSVKPDLRRDVEEDSL